MLRNPELSEGYTGSVAKVADTSVSPFGARRFESSDYKRNRMFPDQDSGGAILFAPSTVDVCAGGEREELLPQRHEQGRKPCRGF